MTLCSYDVQEIELQRRLALEKRLAEGEKKESVKKKKKIKFWCFVNMQLTTKFLFVVQLSVCYHYT